MMDWLRLYGEFATDPKIQMMSEALQRRYIMLLCIRSRNGLETFHGTDRDQSVAFQLRISDEETSITKRELMARNLVDSDWNPVKWSKRQYVSDSSTERVRKHRDKVKRSCDGNTKRQGNVSATPPDTDTDTDKSKSSLRHRADDGTVADAFESRFWPAYPRKVGKADAAKAFAKLKPDDALLAVMLGALATQRDSDEWRRDGGQFVPHPATWINGQRWQDEVTAARRAPVAGTMSDILARAV